VFSDVIAIDSARLRRSISNQDASTSVAEPYEIEQATSPSNESTVVLVDLSPADPTALKANFDVGT